MPLPEGNGKNTFVQAHVIRVDSRDTHKKQGNTYSFELSKEYTQVVGFEVQDFSVPDAFFSQFANRNMIDFSLQNPFINNGQAKTLTAEIPVVPAEFRAALTPRADLFTLVYNAFELAISRDPDFGGKIKILPLFDTSRRLTLLCITFPFLHAQARLISLSLPEIDETNQSIEFLSVEDILSNNSLYARDLRVSPSSNTTQCTLLFASGINASNSAASMMGFANNDITFADFSVFEDTAALTPVRVASGEHVPLSGTLSIIDGVQLVVGDRILLLNQTNPVRNGIYELAEGFNKVRASDMQVGNHASHSTVLVLEGDFYRGKSYICTNQSPTDVVGTDSLSFSLFFATKIATSDFPPDLSGNNYLDITVKEVSDDSLARLFFPRTQTYSLTKQHELFEVRFLENPLRRLKTLTITLRAENGYVLSSSNPFFLNFRVYTLESSVLPPLGIVQNRVNLLG